MSVCRRLVAAVGLAVAFGALAVRSADADVRVTDDTGAAVALASPAQRIVSLAPHATELLFAAGAGARVVGVMSGSDFPQVDVLRAQGIAVFTTHPRTADGIARDIERLGILADSSASATLVAQRFRTRLVGLAERGAGKMIVRVFYQVSDVPLYTVGGDHLITQALKLCGAQNVFASLALPAPEVSIEAVLAAQPDSIVAGTAAAVTPPWLAQWRRWPDMSAVSGNRFFVVDANLLHRPGPRFVDGVQQLCDAVERARGSM